MEKCINGVSFDGKSVTYNRQIHLYSFFNSDVQKMFFWPIKKHLKIV